MAKSKKPPAGSEGTTPAPAPAEVPSIPPKGAATMELFERVQKGDKSRRKEFEALMDDHERGGLVVDFFGDTAARAESYLVDKMTGDNLAGKSAIPRKMKKLREELEGPDPTPLERLLAERAAFCWLVVWHYESVLLHASDLTIRASEFHQRRIDAAHRRYLSSLRTLATVRKLGLPAVQVNIARNQVNVAGPT